MRKSFYLSIIIVAWVVCAQATPLAQNIVYPIEVFRQRTQDHPVRWTQVASRQMVTKSYSGSVQWLYLRVNNLNEAIHMRYRVKRGSGSFGPWQNAQPNWSQFPRDLAYGGLDGGFATTEFATPITGFSPGETHTLQFEFRPSSGTKSAGYRIVAMKLWKRNSTAAVDQISNGKSQTSGAGWQGPFANHNNRAALAEEGRLLWSGQSGLDLKDPQGATITAKCADCHTANGRDLKYFNYSDNSIIARSNLHGLSLAQGQRIAQYIRNLPFARAKKGRPWQPPFQPGPNADDDAYEWAAGQGLENVLTSDAATMKEVFGHSAPSANKIRSVINNFNGNTNIRTQRLSVQFPDWKMWLPEEHPKDLPVSLLSLGDKTALTDAYQAMRRRVNSAAKVDRLNRQTNVPNFFNNNGVFRALGEFAREVHKVLTPYNGDHARSPNWAENTSSADRERMKRAVSAWYAVKLFEVIHEFDLHALDDYQGIPNQHEEVFQWPTREWAVFQNAAHIISGNRVFSWFLADTTEQAKTRSVYLSSVWYQLQLTLTPGHRKGGVVNPNDYSYNLQHVHKLGQRSGIFEPVRLLQNYLKAAEQRNNGVNPQQSIGVTFSGWNMRELSPWRLYSTARGDRRTFNQLGAVMRVRMFEVFLHAVMEKLESFGNNWGRVATDQIARSDFELEFADTVPINGVSYGKKNCYFLDRRTGGGCEDANDAVEIDAAYTLLYLLGEDAEMSANVFNRYRNWCDARWDFSNWPEWANN